MDIRYSTNQRDFKRYTTEETRKEFLIVNLYLPDEVVAVDQDVHGFKLPGFSSVFLSV